LRSGHAVTLWGAREIQLKAMFDISYNNRDGIIYLPNHIDR